MLRTAVRRHKENPMPARSPKVSLVDATEAKNRFGAVIKRAYAHEEHIIVRRGGLPIVAIVPMQDYARLMDAATGAAAHTEAAPELEAALRAAAARARLREFLAEAHAALPEMSPTETEAETEANIAAAIQATRQAAHRPAGHTAPGRKRAARRR